MKHQGLSADEAIEVMYDLGKWMIFYGHLKYQVKALKEYLDKTPCTQLINHCVVGMPGGREPDKDFNTP